MSRTRRLTTLLVAVVVGALALGACSSDSDSSTTTAAGGSSSSAPDKIVIAYQNIPNGDLIVKANGWLEEALPDTEIEWKLFESGGAVNEAALAGSIDFGLAGSSPVSRGISNGIEYQVPWIFNVIGSAEALVVKDDIASIQDLKGKKIATPFASTAHFSLLAALEDAGIPEGDVDIINSEPDAILAAWTQGAIDGAYVWNPTLAELKKDGGKVLVDSAELAEKGKTTYDLAIVTKSFADEYPEAVTEWVKAQNKAVELIQDSPEEAAKILAEQLDITEAEATEQLGALVFVNAADQVGADYLGGGLAKNLFAAAEFNKEQGEIDEVQPESVYQDAVVKTFAEAAAK